MKIGIITIFDAYNYGSFLQAFAMQNFLKERGHEVYMIDVRTNIKSVISQKYLAKSIKRSILKLRRYLAYRKDWGKLNIVPCSNYPDLDMAIIGSDEVWNIENNSFDHSPLYYGSVPRTKKVIAYAPSLGYSIPNSYTGHYDKCKSIKDHISWFGVRDSFTEKFLKGIDVNNVKKVCDPTILLFDSWKNFENTKTYIPEKPYLLYYSYKEETPFKDYILRFARENGLYVISVGFDYKWCDRQMIVSPFEFLRLVRNASHIVTSTYHGTLFATMYKKKFIEVEPARKVIDYLEQIELNKTADINDDYDTFKALLDSKIDYSKIIEKFETMREISVKSFITDNNL